MNTDVQNNRWMPEPGIYENISWAQYISCPYGSPSFFKHGLRSMKRLKRAIDQPEDFRPSEKTVAVGQAVHCMMAGEDAERIAVMPAFEEDAANMTKGATKKAPSKMTKQNGELSAAGIKWAELCKEHGKPEGYIGDVVTGREKTESKTTEYYQEASFQFSMQNEGKQILTQVQSATAKKVLANIHADPECLELIRSCEHEVTVVANVNGLMVKTRMDMLDRSKGVGADLKTTDDIEPKALYRKFKSLNYLFQFGCHNLFLANAGADAIQLQAYDVIAAEIGGDYDVGRIQIVPFELLDIWSEKARVVLEQYKFAKRNDNWLGLYPSAGILEVPEYDMTDNQIDNVQWGA